MSSPTIAQQIDTLTRSEAELMAAKLLREMARLSYQRHRNVAVAAREASQLTHLAIRLESFGEAQSE